MRLAQISEDVGGVRVPKGFIREEREEYKIWVLKRQDIGDCIKILLKDAEVTHGTFPLEIINRYRVGFLEYDEGVGGRKILIDTQIRVQQGCFFAAFIFDHHSRHDHALMEATQRYDETTELNDVLYDYYIEGLSPVYG
jgi:hypothetical protein